MENETNLTPDTTIGAQAPDPAEQKVPENTEPKQPEKETPPEQTTPEKPKAKPPEAPKAPETTPSETKQPVSETPASEDIEALKTELYVLKAGIKPENAADAAALAKLRVKDGVTFEQALKQVAEEFPAFTTARNISPSVHISNDTMDASAETEKIKRIMGIK